MDDRCPDCGQASGHEPGCFQTGGDPAAVRQLMTGPLGKRCGVGTGPDGARITIYLTDQETKAARVARR
jgi:hypothetical protein